MNSPQKILLIDDDPHIQLLFGMALELEGFQPLYASDGKTAMNLLKTEAPDAITLDMMMPILDGMGFLRWLREEAKLNIPVLVLTGMHTVKTKDEVMKLGATDVAFKPIQIPELIQRINTILGN
jgi:DNA-binding response OmpR family regulator